MTALWLLLGAVLGLGFLAGVRSRPDKENELLALGLIEAALIYVGFAIGKGSAAWIGLEVAGLVIYGICAWLGVKKSPSWLVVGWGAHPLWDAGLHLVDGAALVAPYWYIILCISFDLVVAGYVAFRMKQARSKSEAQGVPS